MSVLRSKAKDFPIVNSKDKERIEELIANVPHPKSGTPNWVGRVETKQGIWAKDEQKKFDRPKVQKKERIEKAKEKARHTALNVEVSVLPMLIKSSA